MLPLIIKEFNAYIREPPEFANNIPDNAIVIMQLEGDEEFNKWSLNLAKKYTEKEQPVVFIKIKKIKAISSRIEDLELQPQGAY